MYLTVFQRRLQRRYNLREIRHNGIRFVLRVVLAHRHKIDVLGIHQKSYVFRRRAEGVIGGNRKQYRPFIAQMRLTGKRHGGVGDAVGKLRKRIARRGGDNQRVQQFFRADGLCGKYGMNNRVARYLFDFFVKIRCFPEPCVGRIRRLL